MTYAAGGLNPPTAGRRYKFSEIADRARAGWSAEAWVVYDAAVTAFEIEGGDG